MQKQKLACFSRNANLVKYITQSEASTQKPQAWWVVGREKEMQVSEQGIKHMWRGGDREH